MLIGEIVIKWHHQFNPGSPSTYGVKFITRDTLTKNEYGDMPNIKRIIPRMDMETRHCDNYTLK